MKGCEKRRDADSLDLQVVTGKSTLSASSQGG